MENNQSKEKEPTQIQKTEVNVQKNQKSDFEEVDISGTDADAYKAATRGTDIETHESHPAQIPHPREETGRHEDKNTNP